MTPQVRYALGKALIGIALAILGVVGIEVTNIIEVAGIEPTIWGPIAGALVAGAVRWVEGLRDAHRAEEGKIIRSDVGFQAAKIAAANPNVHNVFQTDANTVYVDNLP